MNALDRSGRRGFGGMGRLFWLVLLVPGCRAVGVSKYAGAAIFAGTAVGAVAVNRAVTGDCWAICSPGWYCNHKSGLCEREKSPPGVHPIRRPAPVARDAGAAADAGAPADAQPGGADAAPDAPDAQPDGV